MESISILTDDFISDNHYEAYVLYKIIVLKWENEGLSLEQIGNAVQKNKMFVKRVIDRFKKHANVHQMEYDACGRTKKITTNSEEYNLITEALQKDRLLTQKDLQNMIKQKLNKKIDQSTISRHLKTIGSYKNYLVTPIISEKNRIKRLDYAIFHKFDKFSNVVFCDESRFPLFYDTRKPFVFYGEDTPFLGKPNPDYSVLVWGAISRRGKIGFCLVNGTMNKETYIKVLEQNLINSANKAHGIGKWRLVQDNAPCHKAYLVKEWLSENVPVVMNHPPQI